MCNLHRLTPKDDLVAYLRAQMARVRLMSWPEKLNIGPFDTGVFIVSDGEGGLEVRQGQWGMIRPGQKERIEYKERPPAKPGGKPRREPMLKNNARIESVATMPAFKDAWKQGRRCLIPADWLQEPNWESGKCVWWQLKRADGLPWMVAGIWSEWTDPSTGEIVPNYAMLTFNVNEHPLLNRLHKPERDGETGQPLPLGVLGSIPVRCPTSCTGSSGRPRACAALGKWKEQTVDRMIPQAWPCIRSRGRVGGARGGIHRLALATVWATARTCRLRNPSTARATPCPARSTAEGCAARDHWS
jgi:putative SOS response-associated peptidase YedK